jgi:murein DD-endopeptidase MepM/ murein hydrolase activator NlpD
VSAAVGGAPRAWRALPADPAPPPEAAAPVAPEPEPAPPPLKLIARTARLVRNETLNQALTRLGVDLAQSQAVLEALAGHVPFRRARAGDQLRIEQVEGEPGLRRFTYRQGPAEEWIVEADETGALRGRKREVELERVVALVAVDVQGSVSEALARAGEDPALAVAAADVLAWDVDFYQDVRPGDRLRVLVEKVSAEGRWLRYGDLLAVEYDGEQTGRKRFFRYADRSGQAGYYDEEGGAARRGILRSPLPVGNVTSRFGSRRHPVLGYERAHQGVDYGAPTGTPVWSVGDGVVVAAGWLGECGQAVAVRHAGGLESVYCHLSSVAVRPGRRVAQRDVVGRVGMTGLATGPHLHFALKRDGLFVNPLAVKLPRADGVAPGDRAEFEAQVAPLRAALAADAKVL